MKIFYKHFQSICKGRGDGFSDILGVKLKYVTRAERAAREVYQQEVVKLRRSVGKRSQVVKIMNELRRGQNVLWEKLMKENEKKVEHLVKKHRSDRIEDRKENDNVSSEEQRILPDIPELNFYFDE